MLLLMLWLPFASFGSTVVCGRHLGAQGTWAISTVLLTLCTILSLTLGYETLVQGSYVTLDLSSWFSYNITLGDVR